jgi:hypothetical protein
MTLRIAGKLLGVATLFTPCALWTQEVTSSPGKIEVGVGLVGPARDLGTYDGVSGRIRPAPLVIARVLVGPGGGRVNGRFSGLFALSTGTTIRDGSCAPCEAKETEDGRFLAATSEVIVRPWGPEGLYASTGIGARKYMFENFLCPGTCAAGARFRHSNTGLAVPLSVGVVFVVGQSRFVLEASDLISRYRIPALPSTRIMHDLVITVAMNVGSRGATP